MTLDFDADTYETTLGAILTHTTGVLVAVLDEAWPLQDWMVGRPLWTHERTAPQFDIAAALLQQFPRLAEAEPPPISSEAEARAWVAKVAEHVGWTTTVVRR